MTYREFIKIYKIALLLVVEVDVEGDDAVVLLDTVVLLIVSCTLERVRPGFTT